MRPIHALLIVAALAAVLFGALFLVRSDSRSGRIAPPVAGVETSSETPHDAPDLDGVESVHRGTDRTRIDTTSATAGTVSGPIGLRGRVVDPEGRGVAGATVYASPSDRPFGIVLDDAEAGGPFSKRKETTTDRDGRFTLEPEAQGSVRLAVRASGFAPYNAQKPIAGNNVDVGDLKLERGVVLTGRVIDDLGNGVANAEIRAGRPPNEAGGVLIIGGPRGPMLGKTDGTGNFRLDRMAVGPWSLLVSSVEHPDKTATGETERAGEVVSNLLITLDPGLDIRGRVVGLPTSGVDDLRVSASERGGEEGADVFGRAGRPRTAEIASDGTFRVQGCKRDTNYSVALRRSEFGLPSGNRSDTAQAKSGDSNIVLTYRAETAITCRVVDKASGKPVEDMHVSAGYRWPMPLMDQGKGALRTHFDGGLVRYSPVSGGPATESATFRIEAVGYTTFERKDLRLVAGSDNDLGVIELVRSALVRVTVLDDATSAPLANASVSLNQVERGGTEMGMTFSIDASADGEDEPVFAGEGAAHRGKTNKDGVVQISSMPGKKVTLSVRHKEHATYKSAPIDLPSNGDHEMTVRLVAGGTVVVEVVDRDKRPVAGLTIDHREPDVRQMVFMPGMPSDTITDAAGRVVFAHIPAGRHLFRVRTGNTDGPFGAVAVSAAIDGAEAAPSELEKGWTEVTAKEGESVTLVLDAPELGELHGRVREGGKPLAGATVRLREKQKNDSRLAGLELPGFMDGGGLSATTNASGDYTLAGAPVGEYTVVVTHPSRAMKWEGSTTLRSREERFDVELPLATIEGRVTNEAGKPVEGAKVSVERAKKSTEGDDRNVEMNVVMIAAGGDDDGDIVSFGGPDAPVVKTDADGRYRLKGVTPNVPLQVVSSSRDYQTSRSSKVELGTDQTMPGVDLVMKQGGSIEVLARRPDGRGVSGAIVHAELVGGDGAPKTQFTGPEGRVTFQGLAPGRWKITCTRTALEPDAQDSKSPPREVEVGAGRTEKVTFDMPQ